MPRRVLSFCFVDGFFLVLVSVEALVSIEAASVGALVSVEAMTVEALESVGALVVVTAVGGGGGRKGREGGTEGGVFFPHLFLVISDRIGEFSSAGTVS